MSLSTLHSRPSHESPKHAVSNLGSEDESKKALQQVRYFSFQDSLSLTLHPIRQPWPDYSSLRQYGQKKRLPSSYEDGFFIVFHLHLYLFGTIFLKFSWSRHRTLQSRSQSRALNKMHVGSIKPFFFEVAIHTLPHLKCVSFLTVRSRHLPFKMHDIGFPCVNIGVRIELSWNVFGWFPCVQVTSHFKCIRFVSMRSNLPCINIGVQIELTFFELVILMHLNKEDLTLIQVFSMALPTQISRNKTSQGYNATSDLLGKNL